MKISDSDMAVKDVVFFMRRKYSLSQAELGQLLGVTNATISNWELEKTSYEPYLILALKQLENELAEARIKQ